MDNKLFDRNNLEEYLIAHLENAGFTKQGYHITSYGPFKGRTSKGELNFPTINQQATQCDEIAKLLLANKQLPNRITGVEGLKDMRIIAAIYEAVRTGKKVSIATT